MAYRIKVIAGPGVGSELELDDGESTIGRAPENALVINDGNVSRVHAKFQSSGNRVFVMDAGSRNGVYVNDRKLDTDEQQPLGPGDRVVIGQSIIELFSENGAKPRTGQAPRAAGARPSNGNGNNMTGTGQIAPNRAPVPVNKTGTTGNKPATRPAAPVAARGPNQMQPRPGATAGAPKVVNRKESQGALSKPMIFGIIGLAVVFALGTMMMNGGGGKKVASNTTPTPIPPPILIPGNVVPVTANSEDKCNPECQKHLDIGDSQRDGGNLKAARDSFQRAVDVEPTCLSCSVRLDSVERSIEASIRGYEKSGILSFEKGDYQRAIDSWEIAIEYMQDPAKLRDPQKKAQADSRRRELKKKIDEASKLIERQPQ